MNELNLTNNTLQPLGEMFRNRFDILISELSQKYPKTFESIVKEAVAQEAIKKFSLKGLFSSLEQGGLFGSNGVFSFLGKTLFKKPTSANLVAKSPLEKDDNTNQEIPSALSQTSLQTNIRTEEESEEKDFLQEEIEPIPIMFAGFTPVGEKAFTEILPPIFEDILKNVFKSGAFSDMLDGLQPEQDNEHGSGLIPGLMSFLKDTAIAGTMFGGGRILGKRGIFRAPFRRFKAGRLKAQRASLPRTAPAVKPPAGAPAVSGATKATSSGALRGVVRGGARAIPAVGAVLTAGMLASDLSNISEQEEKGEITQKEAYEAKGGAYGGAGGALTGAAAGAAIGAAFGGVGAIPGAIIGGILGSIAGGAGGSAIGASMAPGEEELETPAVAAPELPELNIPEPVDYTKSLQDISSNTKNTSNNISRLTDAIFTLAETLKPQPTNTVPNVAVVNNQQSNTPAAAQVAASNIDAIRSVRRRFILA